MPELNKLTGIQKFEFLNQVHKGLREVNKILKERYPESPQLRQAAFKFSTAVEKSATGKIMFFIGYEKSNTTTYTTVDTATISYDKLRTVRPKYASFVYKESVFNLYLEFAGYILRRVADYIIAIRDSDDLTFSKIEIDDTFSIIKSDSGLLGLKFFGEKLDISANTKNAKTITHNFKITFEPYPFKKASSKSI